MNIVQFRKDEITRHFQNNLSIAFIAKLFKKPEKYIRKVLNICDSTSVSVKKRGRKKTYDEKAVLLDYKSGKLTTSQLSEKYNISHQTAYLILKRNGVKFSNKKIERNKKIIFLYSEDKIPVKAIADQMNLTIPSVYFVLKKANVQLRRKKEMPIFLAKHFKDISTCNCNCNIPNNYHDSIVGLYKEGHKVAYIATLFKFDECEITKVIENHLN